MKITKKTIEQLIENMRGTLSDYYYCPDGAGVDDLAGALMSVIDNWEEENNDEEGTR